MPFFDHYPYTNFHNVNLDWVLQAVKSWGAMVEQNNLNFINLEAANQSFKEYVTNYLTNLDVQEEINNKLDEMLRSGALTQYFAPYIQTDVSDWLENNLTPTSPPVDASLTIAGAAADAKATGDAIETMSKRESGVPAELRSTLASLVRTMGFDGDSDYAIAIENFFLSWGNTPHVKVLTNDDIFYGYALQNAYIAATGLYASAGANRASYPYFDIKTSAGHTYKVEVNLRDDILQLDAVANIYTENVSDRVDQQLGITIIDNSGWVTVSSQTNYFEIVSTYNSSMRIALKLTNDRAFDINTKYIRNIVVYDMGVVI